MRIEIQFPVSSRWNMDSTGRAIAKNDLKIIESELNDHLNYLAKVGVDEAKLRQLHTLFRDALALDHSLIR